VNSILGKIDWMPFLTNDDMKKHTRIYLEHFGHISPGFQPISPDDIDMPICEMPRCHKTCVDVHHINNRGMGGSKEKDKIENLMGMCREDHVQYGDKEQYLDILQSIHDQVLELRPNTRA
jgi:hypothetical protein